MLNTHDIQHIPRQPLGESMGIKYFAYGEKMFSPQLYSVVPQAKCLGVAKLVGYKLFFHNRGYDDHSGKCNIVPVHDLACEVYGVLYEIPHEERCLLDKSEGLGYDKQEVSLKVYPLVDHQPHGVGLSQSGVFAFTYIAHKDNIFEDLVPYSWYKELIISGAREHHLPSAYIHLLEQYACTQDPNVQRANKQKRYLESLFL